MCGGSAGGCGGYIPDPDGNYIIATYFPMAETIIKPHLKARRLEK